MGDHIELHMSALSVDAASAYLDNYHQIDHQWHNQCIWKMMIYQDLIIILAAILIAVATAFNPFAQPERPPTAFPFLQHESRRAPFRDNAPLFCADVAASNYGGILPCQYPRPSKVVR